MSILFLVTSSCAYDTRETSSPQVHKGILDLKDWDFSKDGPVKLDGEWVIYWNKFIPPHVFFSESNEKQKDLDYFQVPSVWQGNTSKGDHLDTYGFCTYALKVILPQKMQALSFKLPTVGTAYTLYINGEILSKVGRIGQTKQHVTPEYRPQIIDYLAESGELDIMFHVSNYNYHYGGLWYSIELGSPNGIYKIRERKVQWDFFASGVFFIMFVLHFMLFLLRQNDRLSLFFGLSCLILWLRHICIGEIVILNVLPTLSFSNLVRLEIATFYMAIPLLAIFLCLAFKKEVNYFVLKTIIFVGIICTIIVVITPPEIFSRSLTFYQLWTIFCVCYGLYVIVRAIINKVDGAKVLFFGITILFATTINDILYARQWIFTGYYVDIGLLVFIFCQSYLINYRYSMAFITIERISADLEAKNTTLKELTFNLENKVQERTQELNKAFIELKKAAMSDILTGLPNRRNMRQLLELEVNRFMRNQKPFIIAILDIDKFKTFNDNYGHDKGDEVLKAVANAAKKAIRSQDHLARWGGEEFVFLFPETDLQGSIIVAERIRHAIEDVEILSGAQSLRVTATIGLCEYTDKIGIEGSLKLADEALYQGKEKGRNQVVPATK